jgi:hypothetical protein
VLQERHLRRFGFGLIASRNQHNRRRNRKQNNGAEEEPKGRSKKSFQEKILKKRPSKKNGISDQRISGNIIPPLTWLWGAYAVPINKPWGGLGVALGGFVQPPF